PAGRRRAERTRRRGGPPASGEPPDAPPAAPEGARPSPEPLMHTDRTNRLALTVFALIVFLAGGFGLTASTGGFGAAYAHRALLANRFGTYIRTHGDGLWPAAAAACPLIALIPPPWIAARTPAIDLAR